MELYVVLFERWMSDIWLISLGRQRLVGSQGHGELLWTWYVHTRISHSIHQAILITLQVDVKIPTDIAPGDYLLRAEVIALHVAGGLNGAQFYPSCYQITVAGSGSASPAGVSFPGAYKNTDPGILVDIHAKLSTYIDPGPTVYAGGVSKTPGNTKCTGQAASEGPGGKPATGVSYIDHQASIEADLN